MNSVWSWLSDREGQGLGESGGGNQGPKMSGRFKGGAGPLVNAYEALPNLFLADLSVSSCGSLSSPSQHLPTYVPTLGLSILY